MNNYWTKEKTEKLMQMRLAENTWGDISAALVGTTPNQCRKAFYRTMRAEERSTQKHNTPKILVIDIESLPLVSYSWGTFDQNIALNQIKEDWSILSFAAKFVGSDKVYYGDVKDEKNVRNDYKLLEQIWKLMDESDIILGQNSKRFDVKKIQARLIMNGFQPPSSFRQIDTLTMAKKSFAFTSNKLEYLSKNLCTTNQKISHAKFGGFELWKACMDGNKEAFVELREYNIADVLSTEELYHKMKPWDSSINFNVHSEGFEHVCSCGSTETKKAGYAYSNSGKFQRYKCVSCGAESRDSTNLLTKEKRKSLRK